MSDYDKIDKALDNALIERIKWLESRLAKSEALSERRRAWIEDRVIVCNDENINLPYWCDGCDGPVADSPEKVTHASDCPIPELIAEKEKE